MAPMGPRERAYALGCGVATLLFLLMTAWIVADPAPRGFDAAARRSLGDLAPGATFWEVVAGLGLWPVLAVAAGVLTLRKWLRHQPRTAIAFCAAFLLAVGLIWLVKEWIGRPRPSLLGWQELGAETAFPSGHSAHVVIFLFLTWAAFGPVDASRPRWRLRFIVWGGLLALVTGVARILSVDHWPTDVVGGWLFGIAYGAGMGWIIVRARDQDLAQAPSRAPPAAPNF